MTGVLVLREKFGHRDIQREDSHVKMEAESRVMLTQAKERQRLLATTRS